MHHGVYPNVFSIESKGGNRAILTRRSENPDVPKMKMSKSALFGVAATLAFASATTAKADSLSYTNSFGPQIFGYSTSFTIPKFDSSLGTLTSIVFNLQGSETASQKFESLDASASVITATTTGTMTLYRPNNSVLVVTAPQVVNVFNAAAFDGVIDFAGASGATFVTTSTTSSDTSTTTNPADFSAFTGAGTIALPVTATGSAGASGAGNLLNQFNTTGSTTAIVTYNFTPFVSEVPEASTYGSIGAVAVVGFLGYCRSRKASEKSA